ncbi:MAG: type II secretion system F family protein [Candidatus Aenigmatarchaeota archaeon]|nr:MAG: type II secretion system F family protein [Candidatus Aenigmarchaeota archaeon]
MLKEWSVKLFGSLVSPYLDSFDPLEAKIKSSRLSYTLKEYLSVSFLFTLIAFIVSMLSGSTVVSLFTERAVFSYTFSIVMSVLASGCIFIFFYWYPSIKSNSIRTRIERDIPFAVASMTASASSGTHPTEIFKMMSIRRGIIGEDCKRIFRDAKMFGTDISSAMVKVANRTPSLAWSELLWGLVSVITTGGDMYRFLSEKTRDSMQQYRRMLEAYSRQINFYTEIYITLIIVGTLFFIVLSSVMSPLVGGNILLVQTFLVFFFVPLTSVGFIVLLKGLSPLR